MSKSVLFSYNLLASSGGGSMSHVKQKDWVKTGESLFESKKDVKPLTKAEKEAAYKANDLNNTLDNSLNLCEKVCRAQFKILLVDDDEALLKTNSMVISQILEFTNITTAKDGEEALDLARNCEYDLILSDYRMDKMDGYKLHCALREEGINSPFVMISGYGSFEIEALKREKVLVLPKAASNGDFFDKLERIIKGFFASKLRKQLGEVA